MKSRLLIALLPLTLAACLGRQEALPPSASFDFSPVAINGQAPLPKVEVLLPPWLNGQIVQYRLLHRDPNQLNEYAYARWAGAPAALIQQRLRARLAGVVAVDACRLQLHLQEFVQTFSSDAQSQADLRGEVRVLDAQNRSLGSRQIAVTQPAASADARGGVAALAAAVDQAAKEIGNWVGQEKRLSNCVVR